MVGILQAWSLGTALWRLGQASRQAKLCGAFEQMADPWDTIPATYRNPAIKGLERWVSTALAIFRVSWWKKGGKHGETATMAFQNQNAFIWFGQATGESCAEWIEGKNQDVATQKR